jgi:uncharacterized protein YdeI (YjbR/CyaY-like superfamily)
MATRKNSAPEVIVPSTRAWRKWLQAHHQQESSIWLVIYKKESAVPSVRYPDAVDEALCFGWIDSTPNKRDAESYKVRFAKRNPKSRWSKVNKEKVERLLKEKRMAPAGLEMIKQAKESGTWTALDAIENMEVPADLKQALKKLKGATENFEAFPRSVKKGILEWIVAAKKEETRAKRIVETASLAAKNMRANQWPRK